jgi:hypothetical protein
MKWVWLAWAAGLVVSCGVMGPPVPPEDVGVNPIIERQKLLDARDAKLREAAETKPMEPQGQDVNLPPLRPVGTR